MARSPSELPTTAALRICSVLRNPATNCAEEGGGIGGAGPVAVAKAGEVRGDGAEAACQGRHHPLPIVGAVAEVVEQDQVRRAVAGREVMPRGPRCPRDPEQPPVEGTEQYIVPPTIRRSRV